MSKILLITNSEESALHISRLISRNIEAELLRVNSGSEAVQFVMNKVVDLVVVDVRLPQIDGFDICNKIHELEDSPNLPVLLLTASEGEQYPDVKALSMGPGEIFTIPTPGSNLIAWLNILLKVSSLRSISDNIIKDVAYSKDNLYRTLFNQGSESILWVDAAKGEILIANAACEKVTGYPSDVLEGKLLWDLASLDHQDELRQAWEKVIKNGSYSLNKFPITRRSGMHQEVAISFKALKTAETEGIVVTLKEPTDYAVNVDDASQESGISNFSDFISALAHEVRNPLTGISTNVQYMQMTYADTDTQREIYEDMMEAVHRLDSLFRQAVEMIRPAELKLFKTDLSELLLDVLNRYAENMQERKNIVPETNFEASIPMVEVDVNRFQLIFSLLLEHCIREAHEEGRIICNGKTEPESIELSLYCDSDGLSPSRLMQIFDPVASLKGADKGLGLAYVKRVIDAHNFKIEVESEHGKGITFKISIPLKIKTVK